MSERKLNYEQVSYELRGKFYGQNNQTPAILPIWGILRLPRAPYREVAKPAYIYSIRAFIWPLYVISVKISPVFPNIYWISDNIWAPCVLFTAQQSGCYTPVQIWVLLKPPGAHTSHHACRIFDMGIKSWKSVQWSLTYILDNIWPCEGLFGAPGAHKVKFINTTVHIWGSKALMHIATVPIVKIGPVVAQISLKQYYGPNESFRGPWSPREKNINTVTLKNHKLQ